MEGSRVFPPSFHSSHHTLSPLIFYSKQRESSSTDASEGHRLTHCYRLLLLHLPRGLLSSVASSFSRTSLESLIAAAFENCRSLRRRDTIKVGKTVDLVCRSSSPRNSSLSPRNWARPSAGARCRLQPPHRRPRVLVVFVLSQRMTPSVISIVDTRSPNPQCVSIRKLL